MKYRSYHLLLAGIFSLLTTGAMAEKTSDKPYWQDVQVVSVNKEYPRTSFMTYDNRTDALTGKFEKSNYYQLLNGTWKFFFADSYKDLPANITDPSVSTDSWNDIKVRATGKYKGMEWLSTPTTVMSSSPVIRSLPAFRKPIPWESTVGTSIFPPIGKNGISTSTSPERNQVYMYTSTDKK